MQADNDGELEETNRSCYYSNIGKGKQTRTQIIEHAISLARTVGLEGVSLGALADRTGLSKSGLFAHFKSKEALQVDVVEAATEFFIAAVTRPALWHPRGEARLRALFKYYLHWISSGAPSGCIFMSLGYEFDDRPGPVRDRLLQSQRDWFETLKIVARHASEAGYLRPDVDFDQFAFEFMGISTAYEYALKLLHHPEAEVIANRAFDGLLQRSIQYASEA
ncbi:MAG: TetR/AcrR family transcriptional regulator [Hyphomicrobiales bacterium]|nr:TetR/AcrR family transcriptional regulator [Hyphomicrobiales bacterium]